MKNLTDYEELKDIETMLANIDDMLEFYNNLETYIPAWYTPNSPDELL